MLIFSFCESSFIALSVCVSISSSHLIFKDCLVLHVIINLLFLSTNCIKSHIR
ncbi:MAG: hypothetical protein WCG25_03440 [bacterium]